MKAIEMIKNLLVSNTKKEVEKLTVQKVNDKIVITIFFLDKTTRVDSDAKINPFILKNLKRALKTDTINFEINFITNQIINN